MIRKAVRKDIPNLKKITEACARQMIAQGIFQWNEQYPSVAVFQKDIEQENMYVFELDEKLAGCVMLSFHKGQFLRFRSMAYRRSKAALCAPIGRSSRLSRKWDCTKNDGFWRRFCPTKWLYLSALGHFQQKPAQ